MSTFNSAMGCLSLGMKPREVQSVAHQGAFPPDDSPATERFRLTFLRRLIAHLNQARRRRAAPRVIKRKMPKWHVKRAHHAHWLQPQQQPTYTAIPP